MRLAGATPRFVPLHPPDWRFDPDELAAAFTDKTKAIILCNPNNPTGTVFTREDLERIAALCRKWNVIAVTDEIYEHIIYDGRPHIALAALEGMRERAVTISGMSKTYAVTGWRVGTIIAAATALLTPFARCTTSFRSARPHLSRKPAPPPIDSRDPITTSSAPTTRRARDRFCKSLWETGFDFAAPEGAYYIMAGINAFGVDDDIEFSRYLVREIGVATVPGLELLPRQGARPALRSLLLLQARFHTRRRRRAAAKPASDRLTLLFDSYL